jgi:glycine C-acetyltransferase
VTQDLLRLLANETDKLKQAGLYKPELARAPQQDAGGAVELDLSSYDVLGLADDPALRAAALAAIDDHGPAARGSRILGGTLVSHQRLEEAIAHFLRLPAALVIGSGYAANVGLFEALFDDRDTIFCDASVHPSVAAGVRLARARAVPYRNRDVEDLEDKLKRSRAARFRAIVTDGVSPFSGEVTDLPGICDLAERYDALVVVDDALGLGVLGATGRGAREFHQAMDRVHVVTGSLAKALGAGAGGFVAGCAELIEWLRQKSAPYLFSAALAPPAVASATKAIERALAGDLPLAELRERVALVSRQLSELGFRVLGSEHPILTIGVGDAVTLQKMVNRLYEERIRVTGLCYPVVPEREARIRVQVSVRHPKSELGRAVECFARVGRALGVR